jgi:hypothetical protein
MKSSLSMNHSWLERMMEVFGLLEIGIQSEKKLRALVENF